MGKITENGVERAETPAEEASRLALFASFEPSSPFLPLDPAPFWLGALRLLQLTQEDVLNAIPEGEEREEARIAIRDRHTYLRHDPMVDDLAVKNSIPPEQMDSLWLYVQENFK